jgi:hypothetical protein
MKTMRVRMILGAVAGVAVAIGMVAYVLRLEEPVGIMPLEPVEHDGAIQTQGNVRVRVLPDPPETAVDEEALIRARIEKAGAKLANDALPKKPKRAEHTEKTYPFEPTDGDVHIDEHPVETEILEDVEPTSAATSATTSFAPE